MKNQRKPVPEDTIPEVAAFLEADIKIARMKAAYPEVFQQFDQLVEEYNTALEAADKAVRGRGISCGPFTKLSNQIKYDADKIYEELGRDKFFEVGGQMKTVTVYEVDRARLEAHIAGGVISEEVIGTFRTVIPRYKKPEKINV